MLTFPIILHVDGMVILQSVCYFTMLRMSHSSPMDFGGFPDEFVFGSNNFYSWLWNGVNYDSCFIEYVLL